MSIGTTHQSELVSLLRRVGVRTSTRSISGCGTEEDQYTHYNDCKRVRLGVNFPRHSQVRATAGEPQGAEVIKNFGQLWPRLPIQICGKPISASDHDCRKLQWPHRRQLSPAFVSGVGGIAICLIWLALGVWLANRFNNAKELYVLAHWQATGCEAEAVSGFKSSLCCHPKLEEQR